MYRVAADSKFWVANSFVGLSITWDGFFSIYGLAWVLQHLARGLGRIISESLHIHLQSIPTVVCMEDINILSYHRE